MFSLVPVANEQREVIGWRVEGHEDFGAGVDTNTSEATSCFLEEQGGVIVEAADLIFHFEVVRPTAACLDGAVGAAHPILPCIPAKLNPIPAIHSSSSRDRSTL